MPIQEAIIFKMGEFIDECANEGIVKKIKVSQELIALLYAYLREMGVSDNEIIEYYHSLHSTNS